MKKDQFKALSKAHKKKINENFFKIAIKIKERRKELKLSQEDLAELLGVASSTIQSIEQMRKMPSLQMLLYMAVVLKVKILLE